MSDSLIKIYIALVLTFYFCFNVTPYAHTSQWFFTSRLHLAGNTLNPAGSWVTLITVAQLLELNNLGISMIRIDYAPQGTHLRASEFLTVLEGSLEVEFVTSSSGKVYSQKYFRRVMSLCSPRVWSTSNVMLRTTVLLQSQLSVF